MDKKTQALAALFTHELSGPLGSAGQSLELMERRMGEILNKEDLIAWKEGFLSDTGSPATSGHSERTLKLFRTGFNFKCVKLGIESSIGILQNLRQWQSNGSLKEKVALSQTLKMAGHIVCSRYPALSIRWDIAKAPSIQGSPHALMQVWMNIFSNAAQINGKGTMIDVSLRHGKGRLVITLANSGKPLPCGIDIFEKGKSKRKGGTGLGLYVCRQVIKKHGGTINAENINNRPTFTIELPCDG